MFIAAWNDVVAPRPPQTRTERPGPGPPVLDLSTTEDRR
nr:hypothetical protein JVH1_0244 [Rhodococcus sp. JVH1]